MLQKKQISGRKALSAHSNLLRFLLVLLSKQIHEKSLPFSHFIFFFTKLNWSSKLKINQNSISVGIVFFSCHGTFHARVVFACRMALFSINFTSKVVLYMCNCSYIAYHCKFRCNVLVNLYGVFFLSFLQTVQSSLFCTCKDVAQL